MKKIIKIYIETDAEDKIIKANLQERLRNYRISKIEVKNAEK